MILDTCFCVDFIREEKNRQFGPAHKKMQELDSVLISLPVFVICELMSGAKLSANPSRELKRVEFFKEYIDVIYPDTAFPLIYANVESFLRKQGTPISTMDLLIAVTSLSQSSPLLTRNVKVFENIPNLVVETY